MNAPSADGLTLRVVDDLDECRTLWQRAIPPALITDLWEFRACFQRHYERAPYFIVLESESGKHGLLPLSRPRDDEVFAFFPGETPPGGAWIEPARIPASDSTMIDALLDRVPRPARLRYVPAGTSTNAMMQTDESNYAFLPAAYDYRFETYLASFSHKSRSRMRRTDAAFGISGVTYRYNRRDDIAELIRLNRTRFGAASYFSDERFLRGFLDLAAFLDERGRLRITTLTIGGTIAAVDAGSVYEGTYTVLAGGTDAAFPGAAKLINFHHIEWSCRERLACVDFLSSDFSWKKQFHLTPRPLEQFVAP